MKLYMPMTPGAGAFFICVGIAILVGALLVPSAAGNILLAGFGVGIATLIAVSIIGRKRGLPMIVSVGPLILGLGLACIGVAVLGIAVRQIPIAALNATDGALKLGFGFFMLGGLLRTRPARAAP